MKPFTKKESLLQLKKAVNFKGDINNWSVKNKK
jgi:hypothetical protein